MYRGRVPEGPKIGNSVIFEEEFQAHRTASSLLSLFKGTTTWSCLSVFFSTRKQASGHPEGSEVGLPFPKKPSQPFEIKLLSTFCNQQFPYRHLTLLTSKVLPDLYYYLRLSEFFQPFRVCKRMVLDDEVSYFLIVFRPLLHNCFALSGITAFPDFATLLFKTSICNLFRKSLQKISIFPFEVSVNSR